MPLLLLGDGRLPAGGHAHSGGIEEAVTTGRVADLPSLASFLAGRLATAGLVAAGLAAAACHRAGRDRAGRDDADWDRLDAEADARTASAPLRTASRRQGRQLLRAATTMWEVPLLEAFGSAASPDGPHHAVVLGVVSRAAGLQPVDAALLAAYGSVCSPASAAVRLLSLDPLAVHALVAGLAPDVDRAARTGAAAGAGALEDLPCFTSPLLEVGAEWHAAREVRLFAS